MIFALGSLHSSVSSLTLNDIPNLPGMRSSLSRNHPVLYKMYKKASSTGAALLHEDDEGSLMSYFDGKDHMLSSVHSEAALSVYPSCTDSFNDISSRYSLRSQRRDRQLQKHQLPYISLESVPEFIISTNPAGRVCRFYAFFLESTADNPTVPVRTRKVEILYYLIDDTIEIIEPRVENCGTVQGKFLRRHRIPKSLPPKSIRSPPRNANGRLISSGRGVLSANSPITLNQEFYTVKDFIAGAELVIYGRKYIISNCDDATRRYLELENNIPFGEPITDVPNIDFETCFANPSPMTAVGSRAVTRGDNISRASTTRASKFRAEAAHCTEESRAFFQYDKKILRFYGIWDNRNQLYGDVIQVRVHYSLADNTFEVVPIAERNSGRDAVSSILKKSKIMKPRPGTGADESLSSVGSFSVFDTDPVEAIPYHWTDLSIGQHLRIASVDILLTDADAFTREFYKSKDQELGPRIDFGPGLYIL